MSLDKNSGQEPPVHDKNDHWEKSFYGEDKRFFKKEARIKSKRDRSQYKKTDQDKKVVSGDIHENIKLSRENFLKGRVISINSKGITVDVDGETLSCTLRGLLKRDRTENKNLIVVGDFVLCEKTGVAEGLVAHVEPRFSLLSRADNLSRRKQQLIASNVDQVLITASLAEPGIKPFLIDRYLIAADKGGMKGVIVINKIDLLPYATDEEKELFKEFVPAYKEAGFEVVLVSVETGEGLDQLREIMKDKVSVFSGQSGVGKTSLINLMTGLNMRVREIVEKTGKGAHTTTNASLIALEQGGFCIDTPGIKSFGVWKLDKKEIEGYFPDIQAIGADCPFSDCTHMHEENCAVIKAIEEKKISKLRYDSYCFLIKSLDEEHLRR